MTQNQNIPVLDHGYVNLVQTWGSDEDIIRAARMSTNGGFKGWGFSGPGMGIYRQGDEKLLRFLWTNKHHTPFEMAGLTVEVQAPIFVFREWHRHRTQSYNEMSGRYTVLPDLYYIPSVERLQNAAQSAKNKQGSGGGISLEGALNYQRILQDASGTARDTYVQLLEAGVAREIARLVLPVNQYSRMRASANLRNWLGFLKLRMADNAQWEIRQYANAVAGLVEEHFPRTYTLFKEEDTKKDE